MAGAQRCEYVWPDDLRGGGLRSLTRVLRDAVPRSGPFPPPREGPLVPVFACFDPLRDPRIDCLVLCDAPGATGRARLAEALAEAEDDKLELAFEQPFTLLERDGSVLGWGDAGPPVGAAPFGVGPGNVEGRRLAEAHLTACVAAGLAVSGMHAEALPGQWRYAIGPLAPLELGDSVLLSRWLLLRVAEEHGLCVSLDPMPVKGSWSSLRAHARFSTAEMRQAGGIERAKAAVERLAKRHADDGNADAGFTVRVAPAGAGDDPDAGAWLEDLRPPADADPFAVALGHVQAVVLDDQEAQAAAAKAAEKAAETAA